MLTQPYILWNQQHQRVFCQVLTRERAHPLGPKRPLLTRSCSLPLTATILPSLTPTSMAQPFEQLPGDVVSYVAESCERKELTGRSRTGPISRSSPPA